MSNLCEKCINNGLPSDCQPCYSCHSFPHNPCFEPIKTENKYKTEYVVITKEEYEDMLELIALLKQELNKTKE